MSIRVRSIKAALKAGLKSAMANEDGQLYMLFAVALADFEELLMIHEEETDALREFQMRNSEFAGDYMGLPPDEYDD